MSSIGICEYKGQKSDCLLWDGKDFESLFHFLTNAEIIDTLDDRIFISFDKGIISLDKGDLIIKGDFFKVVSKERLERDFSIEDGEGKILIKYKPSPVE